MKSKIKLVAFLMVTVVLLISTACQATNEPKTANANASLNTNNAPASANVSQPEATKSEPVTTTAVVALSTPTETYKTGYAARERKDLATLKRVFSKDAIEFLTEVGNAEKKTLDDQLRELTERPQASSDETRAEKISGDRASLEYLDEKGNWDLMEFVKEGNEWKIDLPKPK